MLHLEDKTNYKMGWFSRESNKRAFLSESRKTSSKVNILIKPNRRKQPKRAQNTKQLNVSGAIHGNMRSRKS